MNVKLVRNLIKDGNKVYVKQDNFTVVNDRGDVSRYIPIENHLVLTILDGVDDKTSLNCIEAITGEIIFGEDEDVISEMESLIEDEFEDLNDGN